MPVPPLAGRRRSPFVTLRTKGILTLTLLVVYVAATMWLLGAQRQELRFVLQQIESHTAAQQLLTPAFNTLAHTLVQTQSILDSDDFSAGTKSAYAEIAMNLDPLLHRLQRLRSFASDLAPYIDSLQASVDDVRVVPSGHNLTLVRNSEQELIAHMNDLIARVQHRNMVLSERSRYLQQLFGVTAITACVVGAAVSAAVILMFFSRLARDIERLRERAAAVVSGYSGPPLKNSRADEIGELIDAVNQMQTDLRHWERQQEIHRQQRFHQEKMAAVGSMAAAIGHEVNNPIAAIAGVAQYLVDETRDHSERIGRMTHEFSSQILRQTERISQIMRQLAYLTRPHSPHPELLDLNSLVRATTSFIAFDKRFRGIEFHYDMDPSMPAVTAVADHITQVLMNLLINAADAMEDRARHGGGTMITITTQREGRSVRLAVADTGHGMTPEVAARAFEESFSTKPAGRGRGIGLFLCKTLIEQAGGRIELTSEPGVGSIVSVRLPLDPIPHSQAA